MKMSYTRAERRKKEIARAKERTAKRHDMMLGPFETEDGLKDQTKLSGKVRRDSQRWKK